MSTTPSSGPRHHRITVAGGNAIGQHAQANVHTAANADSQSARTVAVSSTGSFVIGCPKDTAQTRRTVP